MQSLVESHVFRESYRESMRLVLSKWWSSSLQRIRFLLEGRQVVPIAHFRPITALVGHVVFGMLHSCLKGLRICVESVCTRQHNAREA